jgi:hypothetical protein
MAGEGDRTPVSTAADLATLARHATASGARAGVG